MQKTVNGIVEPSEVATNPETPPLFESSEEEKQKRIVAMEALSRLEFLIKTKQIRLDVPEQLAQYEEIQRQVRLMVGHLDRRIELLQAREEALLSDREGTIRSEPTGNGEPTALPQDEPGPRTYPMAEPLW